MPAGLTQEHLASIGRVAVCSAHLEHSLDHALRGLTKLDASMFALVLGETSARHRIDLFDSVVRVKLARRPVALGELQCLVAEMRDANSQRNRVIHDAWTTKSMRSTHGVWTQLGGYAPLAIRFQGKKADTTQPMPISAPEKVAKTLTSARRKLQAFSLKHLRIEPSWPSKPP